MKKTLIIFLFAFTFISNGFSQSNGIDFFEVKQNEISSEYKTYKKVKTQALQSKLLYESPEMYSYILGELKEKRFQTFKYKGKKGSILYFEFDKEIKKRKGFIEGLLWGGNNPSKAHPEKVITRGKIMIILSFPYKSKIEKEITEIILKKQKL